MGRSPCCSKEGLNRGSWTREEDMILTGYIQTHGDGDWRNLPKNAGLKRCGKSCRLRWMNYLRPDIKRGRISPDEEDLIIRLHRLLGNRWSLIAGRLPGRTDNEIKNYWNTHLSKKLPSMKQSQANSSTKYLKMTSKSSSPLPNHVFKTIAVKITTAVTGSEIVRPHSCNGHACSNRSSNEAFKSCNVEETTNFSKSCCNVLADDSITYDESQRIALAMTDINFEKAQGRDSTCTMSSLEDEESRHSDHFPEDAAILTESLLDFNDLAFPRWNLLFSPSDCPTDFGLEELYMGAAVEMNEPEDIMCFDQSNMQSVNNLTFPDNQGMEELHDNTHVYCIDEVVY